MAAFFEVRDGLDPVDFDVEQMSAGLTYREAKDLDWVVQVLPNQPVAPPGALADRVGPRNAAQRRRRTR